MIRIAVIGDIGSGKSHIAKLFGYPVFNADREVGEIYKKSRKCYNKLKKKLPSYIKSFPINKKHLTKAIMDNNKNLKKIIRVVHPEIHLKMLEFSKKNKNKKIIILDVPLLIENKINRKNDILVFVDAKKKEIIKRLKKRDNFNRKIISELKKFQLSLEVKREKCTFVIQNSFRNDLAKKHVKTIIKKVLLNDRSNT